MAAIAEEARKMQAMTISFGVPDRGKSKTGVGYVFFFLLASHSHTELSWVHICRFKYDAQVVQCALFPHLHQGSIVVPAKRRKIAVARETQVEGEVEMDSADEPRRGVVLESSKETFLITQTVHDGKTLYTLSVLGPSPPNASQPCPSTLSILPADAGSKTQDPSQTSLPEERKTSVDDPPPSSGATTDPPDSGTSQDATSGKETDASSKPPSISCTPASPKPTARVLRSNLSDGDFAFEKDMIVIKHHADDGKMVVDGDGEREGEGGALKMRVLRWRWYSAL